MQKKPNAKTGSKAAPTQRKRKTKSDTAAGAVAATQAALAGVVPPPDHMKLRPQDLPFWKAVTRARAREMWTDLDLVGAVNLARSLADLETLQAKLDKEGATLTNAKGTQVANPLFMAMTQLTDRTLRLTRLLHVHPAATVGRAADEGTRMREERAQDDVAEQLEDGDELFYTPPNVH